MKKKPDYGKMFMDTINSWTEDFFKEADAFIKRQKQYEKDLKKMREARGAR